MCFLYLGLVKMDCLKVESSWASNLSKSAASVGSSKTYPMTPAQHIKAEIQIRFNIFISKAETIKLTPSTVSVEGITDAS